MMFSLRNVYTYCCERWWISALCSAVYYGEMGEFKPTPPGYDMLGTPKILELECSSIEEFESYCSNLFRLQMAMFYRFSAEEIKAGTHIKVYVSGENEEVEYTPWISDVRAGAILHRRQHLRPMIKSTSNILYPQSYVSDSDQALLINSINANTEQAIVLTRKDSGQVLAASAAYCSFTKPLVGWLADRRNNKRWDQSMLVRLYDDYLDKDPDGTTTSGYEYTATHCQNEEAGPIKWVSDFQQIFTFSEERLRLCRVRFVEGTWDDLS